jgi:hypothetical protein
MKQLLSVILVLCYTSLSAQDKQDVQLFPVVKDGKYGYINIKGELAVSYMYDEAHYFYEGLAAVRQGKKYGFINPNNKIVIEPQFDTVKRFNEGVCAVGTVETEIGLQWGFIDKKGKTLNLGLPAIGYATNFSNNRAIVAEHGFADFFIVSKQGKRFKLTDGLYCFEDDNINYSEGYLRVQKNTGLGIYQIVFVDTNAALVPALNTTYGDLGDVVQGHITFFDNGKYGLLNANGKVVVKPEYDTIYSLSEGLCAVCVGKTSESSNNGIGQYGFIDKSGKWIIKPQPMKCNSFHNGYSRVEINGKYGFINTSGTLVVPAEYDEAHDFFRGLAYVKKDGHWEYINTQGKRVWWQSF